ncbi:hypothetical protein WJX73_005118 [Symbiochloris irregularis]|uniref:PUM-HD domain-containing protein n=1 Tax=Symbiochloris irregularis TaxID=706552 RepID=A0AAW1P7U1_9CHLO
MFGTVGQQNDPVLSTSPNWRDIDKDVARLVGEYDGPRATSAPPQFDDRWAARMGNTNAFTTGNDGRWTPADGLADIRFDEDYEKFYAAQLGAGRKLPPPVDNRTLYNDLPLHIQQSYTPQQQAALNARLSPAPKAYHGTGLDSISEQRASPAPNADDISPTMLQAFSQLALQRHHSPAPPGIPHSGISEYSLAPAQNGSLGIPHSAAARAYTPSHTPPPPSHTPPIPSHTPPLGPASPAHLQHIQAQALAANAAALAAAASTGRGPVPSLPAPLVPPPQPSPPPPSITHQAGNNVAGMMEYQAAYQAAYHAALQQQAAAMLQQTGINAMGPMGQFGGAPGGLHPQVAAHLAGPAFFSNPSVTSAAAAAAASAVQNLMSGNGRGSMGALDHGHEREERRGGARDRRGRRDRRDFERERERERLLEDEAVGPFASRFASLEDMRGQVMLVAKDQNGCRFLQRKFDEGGATAIGAVLPEVLDNLVDLMMDPFGNYLIQKLLDRCSEDQRMQVLQRAAENKQLVSVALNTHGTRAVQKLIETLTSAEQVSLVTEALQGGVVSLIRDLNGNHVIQRCLQRLGPEESQFVYDAAGQHALEIATHRHGCCVLQRCIDFATPFQRRVLVDNIAQHALPLSQDAFGNYVVQYVLELGHTEAAASVMAHLSGRCAELSQQKFSSNVVEKCLKLTNPSLQESQNSIIRELIAASNLSRLLQDPYANYVLQSALTVSSGQLHLQLVDAIRPYLPTLRGTPHGKRILSKINVKL